jgi:very-short-patch-repair endonuclease
MNQEKRIRTSSPVQQRARELRKQMTSAESVLWEKLRDRRLNNLKFRRQAPLGSFIADFYCAEYHLVIEVDGDIHDNQRERDETRTEQFTEFGYRVIRFKNQEVLDDVQSVLSKILVAISESPLPRL